MSWQLPEAPKEREIFLRALREYSEACEPPELTASCPFSVDVGSGVRGCGEECLDLLAAHGAPPPMEEVPLDRGIVMHRMKRPRARRGPDSPTKPFDAKEVHATDRPLQLADWRVTSLLLELRDLVRAMVRPADKDEHSKRVDAVIEELGRRDIPAKDVLVDGLAYPAALSAVMAAAMGHAKPDEAPWADPVVRSFSLKAAAKADRDADLPRTTEGEIDTALVEPSTLLKVLLESSAAPKLTSWMRAVGTDGVLLRKTPRSVAELESISGYRGQADSDATWLLQRLTTTYLDGWSTESLKQEWLWCHSRRQAPAPARVMRERHIDEQELACELADRLADMSGHEPPPAPDYVSLAVAFLRSGDRAVAASIFKQARAAEPDDVTHVHNEGFCLIPDDPERALELLQHAASQGYEPIAMNAVDQAVAMARLGRDDKAQEQMELAVTALGDLPRGWQGYLWDLSILDGSDPALVEVSVVEYIREAAERLLGA